MSTEIYYFSGTGNSLFVARELQKKLPDSLIIPIISLLHKDTIKTNGKTIGIVFPCHALTIPIALKHFIKKLDVQSAEYIFAVATRYGTAFKGFSPISKQLKKKNKQLNSQFILNMCHNEAPRSDKNYVVPSKSDILEIEAAALQKIDEISNIVKNQSSFAEKDKSIIVESSTNPIIGFLIEQIVVFLMNISEYIGGVNYFYCDSKCNGCGICQNVCLSEKIKIVDKKPVWQKDVLCYMCYACVNYCPKQSVQVKDIHGVKSYTTQNGRYPHPYATVNDISAQKKYL
ncbi:MAG: EFR1 family ferrodoxin [Bacillota bacterium]